MVVNISIGTSGHVEHGKTSLISALTGKSTLAHSEELKRGITIRLGYAFSSIYTCPECAGYEAYKLTPKCLKHSRDCEKVMNISFVDAPGHETLMTTMISGASIMDGALLVIAANEACPQPQTREHLMALDIIGIKNVIIVQNKIDLVTEEQAKNNYEQIKKFVKGTIAENAPIVPISAHHGANIDALLSAIIENFKPVKKGEDAEPVFLIARSFDINKPGAEIKSLKGGIFGGAMKQGSLKLNDSIVILPGIKDSVSFKPLKAKIVSLNSFGKNVEKIGPEGSVGIGTELDPSLTKSDSLAGNVIVLESKPIEPLKSLTLEVRLLDRAVGTKEEIKLEPLKINEELVVNVWTTRTIGTISSIKNNKIELQLKSPVVTLKNEKVAISRRIQGRWRLIGCGVVV